MAYGLIRDGEIVYVRAEVLTAQSDACQVRIAGEYYTFTTWAPPSEIARFEDIPKLRPRVTRR